MIDGGDKARAEFLSEAQELVESLSRNLLAMEQARQNPGAASDPEYINEAFRSVHTLKSLSGLFSDQQMTHLSHRLEDLLDNLRLGRQTLTDVVFDLLFTSVDVYWKILTAPAGTEVAGVESLLQRLEGLSPAAEEDADDLAQYQLDPSLLAVLTEYEEHRLMVSVKAGLGLFLVRVQFDLLTLDTALSELKEKAKPFGEVITYLPAGQADNPDLIELDLLLASGTELPELEQHLGAEHIVVREIAKQRVPTPAANQSTKHAHSVAATPGPMTPAGGTSSPHTQVTFSGSEQSPAALLRSISKTVRVDIQRLDELMGLVGKLGVLRSGLADLTDGARGRGERKLAGQLSRLSHRFERSLRELQSGILEVRMVPLTQVFERLTRVVRQTSRDLGKDVRLVVTGADTEIDKLIVEELSDPLMHIVRNAIDHGIEDGAKRAELGKPESGTIALNAFQKGNHVVIEAEDDGRGLNSQALVDKALTLGVLSAQDARELSRGEALSLIFLPGLSTRKEASTVSGRGVGMDVVKTNISKLGGSIELESEAGIGTKITLTLPLTRAIVNALLVQVDTGIFAVPLTSILEVNALSERDIRIIDRTEVLDRRGSSLELCRLRQLLELQGNGAPSRQYVVEVVAGARRLGLVVDSLLGQQDIIIRPLGRSLHAVRGFSGASELADERIALVLDPGALIDEAGSTKGRDVLGRLASGSSARNRNLLNA